MSDREPVSPTTRRSEMNHSRDRNDASATNCYNLPVTNQADSLDYSIRELLAAIQFSRTRGVHRSQEHCSTTILYHGGGTVVQISTPSLCADLFLRRSDHSPVVDWIIYAVKSWVSQMQNDGERWWVAILESIPRRRLPSSLQAY